ncbi:hypothetical protein LXA43DRAFT_215641 [Ganoderma leucocontextum]|nr:hypothetical protein LXA43DRAFT_215641 [Ganoderma leucocontextum]
MPCYPVYVIHLSLPTSSRLCIAVALDWDRRDQDAPIAIGDVYYADGCPAQGYRFSVLRNVVIPRIRGYRGKSQVGHVESRDLRQFQDTLATTDLHDGLNWTFNALRRLAAHHFAIPIYEPEPVYKGLVEGRRAWEQGDD